MEAIERFFPEDENPAVRVRLLLDERLSPACRKRLRECEEHTLFSFAKDTLLPHCFPEGKTISPPPLLSARYHLLSEKDGVIRLSAVYEMWFREKKIFGRKATLLIEAEHGRFVEEAKPEKPKKKRKTHRRKNGGGRS